jgi:protein TonB
VVKRYSASVFVGAIVTVVLLYVMQAVISTDESGLNEAKGGKILDFVRLQEDEELIVKQRKPKPPPPPDEPPPVEDTLARP